MQVDGQVLLMDHTRGDTVITKSDSLVLIIALGVNNTLVLLASDTMDVVLFNFHGNYYYIY